MLPLWGPLWPGMNTECTCGQPMFPMFQNARLVVAFALTMALDRSVHFVMKVTPTWKDPAKVNV